MYLPFSFVVVEGFYQHQAYALGTNLVFGFGIYCQGNLHMILNMNNKNIDEELPESFRNSK